MKKIAFIIQRYGLEINGGAELHCRQLAEKLVPYYEVEVLTTCAIDYLDWADHYPEGVSKINGVTVRRFKVSQVRNGNKMSLIERKTNMRNEAPRRKGLKKIFYNLLLGKCKGTTKEYTSWIMAQGPTTPALIEYLKKNEEEYSSLIFFTYLYYPTVFGINTNPAKTIFVPTAHDDWCIRIPLFKNIFNTPACIMYNTESEQRMVNRLFGNESIYSEIAGVGVDVPGQLKPINVKQKWKLTGDYILYIGRIDIIKISDEDFDFFLRYNRETKKDLKLVLIGNAYRKIPKNKNIIYLGFVSDEEKFNLLQQCIALFQPSKYESLSMVVLEAFMMKRPVIVHADCEVMKDHVDLSGGGFYFREYHEFKNALQQLINDKDNKEMGEKGKAYAESRYQWTNIVEKFRYAIDYKMKA